MPVNLEIHKHLISLRFVQISNGSTKWWPFVRISNGWASRFQISFKTQPFVLNLKSRLVGTSDPTVIEGSYTTWAIKDLRVSKNYLGGREWTLKLEKLWLRPLLKFAEEWLWPLLRLAELVWPLLRLAEAAEDTVWLSDDPLTDWLSIMVGGFPAEVGVGLEIGGCLLPLPICMELFLTQAGSSCLDLKHKPVSKTAKGYDF